LGKQTQLYCCHIDGTSQRQTDGTYNASAQPIGARPDEKKRQKNDNQHNDRALRSPKSH